MNAHASRTPLRNANTERSIASSRSSSSESASAAVARRSTRTWLASWDSCAQQLDVLQKRFRIERAFIPSRGIEPKIGRVCGRCFRSRLDVEPRSAPGFVTQLLCAPCAQGVSGDPPKH